MASGKSGGSLRQIRGLQVVLAHRPLLRLLMMYRRTDALSSSGRCRRRRGEQARAFLRRPIFHGLTYRKLKGTRPLLINQSRNDGAAEYHDHCGYDQDAFHGSFPRHSSLTQRSIRGSQHSLRSYSPYPFAVSFPRIACVTISPAFPPLFRDGSGRDFLPCWTPRPAASAAQSATRIKGTRR
jgi:hypothetical protein